jgi:predicted  nucleic acid-binding Zn-ribbon protein
MTETDETSPRTEAEYRAAVQDVLEEIRLVNERMTRDREAVDRQEPARREVQELRTEVRSLAAAVRELQSEVSHLRALAARDREYLELRLENHALRTARDAAPRQPAEREQAA